MSSSLHATHLIADLSATQSSADLNIKPVEPPFVQPLFHHGIVVWWVLIVAGVVGLAAAVYAAASDAPFLSADTNARTRIGTVSVGLILVGAVFVFLSY